MDPLTQQLLMRQLQGNSQMQGQSGAAPVIPPNGPSSKVPPQVKRFENAQAIQDAYRGDWSPNPILLRAQLGHR